MLRTASPPSATIFDFRPVLFYTAQGRSRRNTLLTLHAQSDGGIISICRRRPPVFSKPSSDSIEFVPVSSHPDDTGSTVKQDLERDLYPETMVCEEDFSITVLKVEGRKNRRRIRSRVQVDADLSSVWRVLTDYEGLATFISGLAVSQLLERKQNFAKLYQVGEQNLALGLKFHAKGVIECCEGELEDTPMARRREIEFRMVEGDFQTFEGRWSIEQVMGNGGSRFSRCFDSNGNDAVNLDFLEPLDEGLGHSFCYIRPVITDSPAITPSTSDRYTACSSTVDTETHSGSFRQEVIAELNSSLPETTFKTISGASVSANASAARTGVNLHLLLSGETQQPAASFESTASFAAIPLQPVPRGSKPSNGFLSGPLERGLASGPLDNGSFLSGPIDYSDRNNFSGPAIYVHGKGRIKRLARSMSRPVRTAFSRTITKMRRSLFSSMTQMFFHSKDVKIQQIGTGEAEYSNTKNLQWAHGKAGEDRVHVVLSEEQAWLFVGIYDGFSGPDAPDFLMSNLYKAIDKELEGVLWDYVDQCQENLPLAVLPSSNPLCSCSDFVGEGIMLIKSHNVVTETQNSNSQFCDGVSVERNSEEAVPFWSEPEHGEVDKSQNLNLVERIAPSACDNTLGQSRRHRRLSDLLQMEIMEKFKEKEFRLPLETRCGISCNSGLSFKKDSSDREDRAETQPVTCSTNIGIGTEVDSNLDPKECCIPSSSSLEQKKMLERYMVILKLRKICRKQKYFLRKLFRRSYQLQPSATTINPSVAVWKCKSGPIDHDAVMKAMVRALEATEEAYTEMVEKALDKNPELALMGSCVLVMLMKDQDVYVMNLGDSRVVLAQDRVNDPSGNVVMKDDSRFQNKSRESLVRVELDRISEESPMHNPSSHICNINKNREISLCKLKLRAVQLSSDHSTNIEDELVRIKAEHVDDPQAVLNGRVKGQLKVTRAFGAEFLKQPRFNDALLEMFRVDYVGTSPYLSCDPSVVHHRLCPNDRFLVLSSDGLYEYFSNEEVISHVAWFMDNNPDGDPAQYLIAELLFRAAKKNGMEFHELLDIPHGDRRKYHDDVSVMVISLEGRIWRSSG